MHPQLASILYAETIGRLGVYTLDGNESHSNLLEFVINAETMEDVIVVITLDMSQPWSCRCLRAKQDTDETVQEHDDITQEVDCIV